MKPLTFSTVIKNRQNDTIKQTKTFSRPFPFLLHIAADDKNDRTLIDCCFLVDIIFAPYYPPKCEIAH
jgi:hypothetical protein